MRQNRLKHFDSYLLELQEEGRSKLVLEPIRQLTKQFTDDRIKNFSYRGKETGLLVGNVQSGKTGMVLGIIAVSADYDFEIFNNANSG